MRYRILAGVLALALVFIGPGVAQAETLTAAADSYTKSDVPGSNFGTTTTIRLDGTPASIGYVKFDVPAGTVESAVLRLTAASSASSATTVHTTGSSWTESGLTYSNAPAIGAQLGFIPTTVAGGAHDVDVSSAVSGGSSAAFALATASGTARKFNSREAATGKPQLVVTFSTEQPPPPPPSSNTVDTVHTLVQMHEDARRGAHSTKSRFEGRHGGTAARPYQFDMRIKVVSGDSQGQKLVFRERDAENFYQLDIEQTEVKIREKVAGRMVTKAVGCDGFRTHGTSYDLKLLLKGATIEVYEHAETVPCITWTDPDNTFPVGENASYYCAAGNYCIWEEVDARPVATALLRDARLFTGQAPGYLTPQTINPTSQSILESRWPYTVQNYRFGTGLNGGSSTILDRVEHGAAGNVEYHLDRWSAFGATIVYRAKVGQYGYHLRLDSTSTTLQRKNPDGTFTTLGRSPTVVPVDRHIMVKVDGSRHRLIDEGANPDVTLIDVTDSTYPKGRVTYWGVRTGTMDNLLGSFRALP
jgi:hypothetical protein